MDHANELRRRVLLRVNSEPAFCIGISYHKAVVTKLIVCEDHSIAYCTENSAMEEGRRKRKSCSWFEVEDNGRGGGRLHVTAHVTRWSTYPRCGSPRRTPAVEKIYVIYYAFM
jgi:hypothetical protein